MKSMACEDRGVRCLTPQISHLTPLFCSHSNRLSYLEELGASSPPYGGCACAPIKARAHHTRGAGSRARGPPPNTPTAKHSHLTSQLHPPSSKSRKHIPRTSDSNTQPSLSMALLRVSTSPMVSGYTNYHPSFSSRTPLKK